LVVPFRTWRGAISRSISGTSGIYCALPSLPALHIFQAVVVQKLKFLNNSIIPLLISIPIITKIIRQMYWKRWKRARTKFENLVRLVSIKTCWHGRGQTSGKVIGIQPGAKYSNIHSSTAMLNQLDFSIWTSGLSYYTQPIEPPCTERYVRRWRKRSFHEDGCPNNE
jgi:hypothetical protein